MRTISLEMIGWNIRVPAESDFAGRNRENNATKIEITTNIDGCAYSIDMMAGLAVRSDVMAVDDGVLSYTIPESMTKSGNISFQVVGIFEDGKKIKSNVIKCKIGPSINAVEKVEPEETTRFEQALAAYSEKLSLAISSAMAASKFAELSGASGAAAKKAADDADYAAGVASVSSTDARNSKEAAAASAGSAARDAASAAESANKAISAGTSVKENAEKAAASEKAARNAAKEAEDAAKQAQSTEAISTAIKWHNLDALAHPEIRSMIPDLKGFVKYTTQDLVWYYKKTETYTKSEVNALIEAVPKFSRKVVDELPVAHISDTTIYLLRSKDPQTGNLFTEYIYVDGAWEIIGGQSIEISGYVKTEELNTAIMDLEMSISETYATKDEIIDAYTKEESDNRYAGKAVEQEIVDQKESIGQLSSSKIDKPSDAPTVGKILKVKSVNEDGSFTVEWDDAPEPDLTGYVKDTDVATNSKKGVVSAASFYNFGVLSNGQPYCPTRTEEQYIRNGNDVFVSKGTLNNIKENLVTSVIDIKAGANPQRKRIVEESDLEPYVKNTDYATSAKGGVVKSDYFTYGSTVNSNGYFVPVVLNETQFKNASNNSFVSKGTLENIKESLVKSVGDAVYAPRLNDFELYATETVAEDVSNAVFNIPASKAIKVDVFTPSSNQITKIMDARLNSTVALRFMFTNNGISANVNNYFSGIAFPVANKLFTLHTTGGGAASSGEWSGYAGSANSILRYDAVDITSVSFLYLPKDSIVTIYISRA